jgi:AcrR family transcriptional regulator
MTMTRRSPNAPGEKVRKRTQLRESAHTAYRDAILTAAEQVFAERDFATAKMTDIAREAGVAAGTLYNYFESKDEIVQSLVEARGDELVARMEKAYGEVDDALLRLTVMIRVSLEYLEEHRAIFMIFARVNGVDFGVAKTGDVETRFRRCLALYERAVREGIGKKLFRKDLAVDQQVALLSGAIHGVVRAWFMAGASTPLARNTPMLVEFIVNGLGNRK